jgi:hypothetical protein
VVKVLLLFLQQRVSYRALSTTVVRNISSLALQFHHIAINNPQQPAQSAIILTQ